MEHAQKPTIQACYINGQTCRNGKRDDFSVDPMTGEKFFCNKWVKLVCSDPQTGHPIDTWCCNEFAKVKLGLEQANMTRLNTASTDKVATEVAKHHATFLGVLNNDAQQRLLDADPRMQLESKNGHTGA